MANKADAKEGAKIEIKTLLEQAEKMPLFDFVLRVVGAWFVLFWVVLLLVSITDSGWIIFGAFVTWIGTGILAAVLVTIKDQGTLQ